MSRKIKLTIYVTFLLSFFSILFFLLLNKSMLAPLDHDEHQFIASGKLLATEHLIPYRDFAYFHMPNGVFIYSFLFKLTDYLLFSARLFTTLCAFFTIVIFFLVVSHLFREIGQVARIILSAGSSIILFTNPLFVYTSGKAWNHDFPVLLVLSAFILHSYGIKREERTGWLFASGFILGFAIATRLTFIFTAIPFLAIIFLSKKLKRPKAKLYSAILFISGIILSMSPSFYLFFLAPKQFIFGNFTYPLILHPLYEKAIGNSALMTLSGKMGFLQSIVVMPGNLLLSIMLACFMIMAAIPKERGKLLNYLELIFILILIPFLFIGAISPAVIFPQYLYCMVPFLELSALYLLSTFLNQGRKTKLGLMIFLVAVILSSIYGIKKYFGPNNISAPDNWIPIRYHKTGMEISRLVSTRKVLTLAPIFPLEGGAGIYREFATGPFAWRVAHFIPEEARKEAGVISENDLDSFFELKAPAAILTGFEGSFDEQFLTLAKKNSYKKISLSDGGILWLSGNIPQLPGGGL